MAKSDASNVPQALTKPKLLLCEGPDDKAVFEKLLGMLEITDVQVDTYLHDSKHQLGATLRTLRLRPGFDDASNQVLSLAITRDADFDDRFADADVAGHVFKESVCSFLKNAGFAVPDAVTVKVESTPRVSVFILPDCERPGAIEDLCLSALDESVSGKCVADFFVCLESSGIRPSKIASSKVRMLAWASPWLNPNKPRWREAALDHIDFNHPVFDKLKDFLRNL